MDGDQGFLSKKGAVLRASGSGFPIADDEPWSGTIDPRVILEEMAELARKYVVAERETIDASILWCALTWYQDVATVLPIALITSPEKNCGKSTLLAFLGRLSCRRLLVSNISASSLFRCIDMWHPTLLVDEADTFAKDNPELRGILNSGHTRDAAYVVRAVEVKGDFQPRVFSTWAPKALAGIGSMPKTIESRSIILRMRRALPGEVTERLRHSDDAPFAVIRSKLSRWASDCSASFAQLRPTMRGLSNRDADNWEPLLAIADLAGGSWPLRAREAARRLGQGAGPVGDGEELLAAIRAVFLGRNEQRITTEDLLGKLCDDSEAPWASWNRGLRITPRQLAHLLAAYGIEPCNYRFGSRVLKGYSLSQFADSFSRYLSDLPPATPLHCNIGGDSDVAQAATEPQAVADEDARKALRF